MDRRPETGVEVRNETSIRIRFMLNGVEKRETIKLPPTKRNLRYASNFRSEILRKIEIGTFNYYEYFPNSKQSKQNKAKIPLLSEIANDWLKIQFAERAYSSYLTYKKYLDKYWLPKFGERRIDSIVMSEISTHLASINVSPKTRNNILIPMRNILATAFYDGSLKENPCDRIKNVKAQKPEPDPFNADEIDVVLNFMIKNYNEQVPNYFEFAFFTGLRTSEIIELKWSDIHEDSIVVSRARVEGQVKSTKTYKSRHVLLNNRAKDALKRQEKLTKNMSVHVFLNPNTNLPWNDQRAQSKNYWHPTLEALKLSPRDPYQTRHTFATLMLMNGANPMWVSKQMGHVNMKMLLEVYARWIDLADKSQEINKINSKLFAQISPTE